MANFARLLVILALLPACRQSPAPAPPALPPPAPAPAPEVVAPPPPAAVVAVAVPPLPLPLDERLTAQIGQGHAVLLDLREDGVWAKSLDGARKEQLAATAATWLWPDAQTRVLWLWREADGALQALDLAVPLPQPVTVATGVPVGLAWLWPTRAMVGPDDARLRLSLDPRDVGFQFGLPPEPGRWEAPRRWRTCGRGKAKRLEPQCPVLAPGAEALLRSWAGRISAETRLAGLGRAGAQPIGCTPQSCGVAHTLGATHWWLVPAAVWSDCCRRGHQLYDARTHRFLRLGAGKLVANPSGDRRDTVESLWLCPLGDAIVTESGVVPLEPPGALRFGDADACLGGQPLRTPSLPCPQGDQCEDDPANAATDEARPR